MATKYLSPSGNDANPGTYASPFLTGTAAVAACSAGDTLIAAEGVYPDAFEIDKALTVRCEDDGRAIFDGSVALGGTWVQHSGDVWKQTGASDPVSLIFETAAGVYVKGFRMDALGEVTGWTHFYFDSGATTLYAYLPGGPTAFRTIKKVGTGGIAGAHASTGGIYVSASNVSLDRLEVVGWRYSGLLGDDCTDLLQTRCRFALNGEDGTGGFAIVRFTLDDCDCEENGTRRPRAAGEISTDGDGASLHANPSTSAQSTDFLIRRSRFRNNYKDGVQNINASTGVVEQCLFDGDTFGVIVNASAEQILRNNVFRMGSLSLNAIGVGDFGGVPGCVARIVGNTVVGADVAAQAAILQLNGTATAIGNIFTGWALDAAVLAGTFAPTYNRWNVTTRLVAAGTGETDGDPQLRGSREQPYILVSSPCAGVSGVAAAFATYGVTHDYRGSPRGAAPSLGACEPGLAPSAFRRARR